MADFARQPLAPASLDDLLKMAHWTPEDRILELHKTLKVGLARCGMQLAEMPFGFCNATSIKKVSATYIKNFRELMQYEHRYGVAGLHDQDYHDMVKSIFDAHRGTMLDVAKGVFEFVEDLQQVFGPDVHLPEVRDSLAAIRDLEVALDEFFTDRLTLRLLISHTHSLPPKQDRRSLEVPPSADMVGIVSVKAQPLSILTRAFRAAQFMCNRDFNAAPELLVNNMSPEEFMMDTPKQQSFAYVQTHLFYIFLELSKNASRASIERAQLERPDARLEDLHIPPVRVVVPDSSHGSVERTVKLSDSGCGMSRSVLSKAFSYFYSSMKTRPRMAEQVSDFDQSVPLAGFGFGLPISRIMARYFAGEIDVNSIPGTGTDVYVYL